jgi:hypothetical protein
MITNEEKIQCLQRWREIMPRLRRNLYAKAMMRETFGEEANEIACLNAIIADLRRTAREEQSGRDRAYPPWPLV